MAMDFKKSASKLAEDYRSRTATGGDNNIAKGIRSMMSSAGSEMQIQYIPLDQIDTFKNHPFDDLTQEEMDELVESVVRNAGTLTPAIVRRKDDGRYEMISGHQRKRACELAGLTEIPVIIRQLTDEEAVIQMVDTNIQRKHIRPSVKARAYQMKMEAMQRQGQRNDLTSGQVVPKLSENRTGDIVGKNEKESYKTVQRYIRLLKLIPSLLAMVDEKKLPFMTGVTLSHLSEIEQNTLLIIMGQESVTPSLQQAEELKKRSKEIGLHGKSIREILCPDRYAKPTVKDPEERRAEREAEAALCEPKDAELEADLHVAEQIRMELARARRDDPNEEPLTITAGNMPGDAPTDDALHVFFQAAKETHGAMKERGDAERTAKAVCKRLESLQDWFESNTDKDTLNRFVDVITDLEELLDAQGLLNA